MDDFTAVSNLSKQIQELKALANQPDLLSDVNSYKKSLQKVSRDIQHGIEEIQTYLQNIQEKLDELREVSRGLTRRLHEEIEKVVESLEGRSRLPDVRPDTRYVGKNTPRKHSESEMVPSSGKTTPRNQSAGHSRSSRNLEKMRHAKAMQDVFKKVKIERLNDLINVTTVSIEKVEEREELTTEDIENQLKCLSNLVKATYDLYEEEDRQRQASEQKREARERRKREKEKQKQLEDERQRQELERKQRKQEKRDADRLQKESEERARRRDPANWKPVVYGSVCDGQVSAKRRRHDKLNCIMMSQEGGLQEEDVECLAGDEVDSIIEILAPEERPVSSVLDINARRQLPETEVPTRFYIPHHPAFTECEEIFVKTSVNGSDWVASVPVAPTPNLDMYKTEQALLAGLEANTFTNIKAMVVSRPRFQTIEVDERGTSTVLQLDHCIRLSVPENAVKEKTTFKIMVQPVKFDSLINYSDECDDDEFVRENAFVTVQCQKSPSKSIEIDFLTGQKHKDLRRRTLYQLYQVGDKVWKSADVESRGRDNDLTVTLPPGQQKYVVTNLEVPPSLPRKLVLNVADGLYGGVTKTPVRMVVRQRAGQPEHCRLMIVKEDLVNVAIKTLKQDVFTASEGAGISPIFFVQEGHYLQISFAGNIEADSDLSPLCYLTYQGGVSSDLTLKVKDVWKQKDFPAYNAYINCAVLDDTDCGFSTAKVLVSLPKVQRERTVVGYARVRIPYYLTSLTHFTVQALFSRDKTAWQPFLKTLLGENEFECGLRLARRKVAVEDSAILCTEIMLDWIKTQTAYDDKIVPITTALNDNKLAHLAQECQHFAQYHKDIMTDDALKVIARSTKRNIRRLGRALEVDQLVIDRCIKEHPTSKSDQKLSLFMAWRESDKVVKYGDRALEHLKTVCA